MPAFGPKSLTGPPAIHYEHVDVAGVHSARQLRSSTSSGMPDRLVTDLAERLLAGDPSMDDETLVESLNGRFDVSAQAMRYRLANLGVISVW